ncbi:MAG: hypothetical protein QOD90_5051 [Mycobacterium sp.]|jgi:hypothetical protein|nr:hypothetical protein [Mycobacterium sp.]
MGPTRKRDLAAATVIAAILGYTAVRLAYHWFPPITLWTGLSLLGLAAVEVPWAFYVRSKIGDGKIGDAPGRLHPLAVARAVMISKASALVGALALGWWVGVLVFLLPKRDETFAGASILGTVVAAVSALALVVAALWLQHCCKSPDEPPEDADGVRS